MKLRVRRHDLIAVVKFYHEQLAQSVGPAVLSESHKEIARREFLMLQMSMRKQERTNAWQVPLILEFNDDGTYIVELEDERKILIMD